MWRPLESPLGDYLNILIDVYAFSANPNFPYTGNTCSWLPECPTSRSMSWFHHQAQWAPTLGEGQHGKSHFQELLGSVDHVSLERWCVILNMGVRKERCDILEAHSPWEFEAGSTDKKQLLDCPAAGHLGIKKTVEWVKACFYWCGQRKDVESWCNQCDVCASQKKLSKAARAPMKTYQVGAPMERIAIDVMGPYRLLRKATSTLVISDYVTKMDIVVCV